MKVIKNNQYLFTPNEVADILMERLEMNDKLDIDMNDLEYSTDGSGNFIIVHKISQQYDY